MNVEYIIVGDTEKYSSCLIYVVGSSFERAEQTLNRMLNNPNDNDKMAMKGCINFRIEEVASEECWWRD